MVDAMIILQTSKLLVLFIMSAMSFLLEEINADPYCNYMEAEGDCCDDYGRRYIIRNSSFTCHTFSNLSHELFLQYPSSSVSDSNNVIFLNSSLHKIPALAFHIFSNLNKLYLNNSDVNTMEMGAFVGLTKLEELHLDNNKISNINIGTLNHILSLKTLIISNNNIKNLNEAVFKDLTNLEKLYLNGNKLQLLQEGLFSSLSSVIEIDLSQNSLKSLNFSVFHHLTELQLLNLSRNQIQTLPRALFRDLSQLEVLDLSKNFLNNISYGLLSGLKQLKYLNVSYNRIIKIDSKSLYSLQYLVDLNVAGNRLSYLDAKEFVSLFEHLKHIQLEENKWTCDTLFSILKIFRMAHVLVESGNSYQSDNIHGIDCNPLLTTISEEFSIKNLSTNLTSTISDSQLQHYYQQISNILLEISEKISNNNNLLEQIADVELIDDINVTDFEYPNISSSINENVENISKTLINLSNKLKFTGRDDVSIELKNELVKQKRFLEEISKRSAQLIHFQDESTDRQQSKLNNTNATYSGANIDNANMSAFMNNVHIFMKNLSGNTALLQSKVQQLATLHTNNQVKSEPLQTGQSTADNGNEKTATLVICLSVVVVILFIILGVVFISNTKYNSYTVSRIRRFTTKSRQNKSDVDLVENGECVLNSTNFIK